LIFFGFSDFLVFLSSAMKFSALIGLAVTLGVATAAPKSLVETIQSIPELSSFGDALVQAKLDSLLASYDRDEFTIFAPTNEAFAAMSSVVEGWTAEQFRDVLEYHIIYGGVKAGDLINHHSYNPLFNAAPGHSLGVSLDETDKIARIVGENNAVTVTTADILYDRGVVHIVDDVLIPNLPSPEPTSMNIVETAQATPALSSLAHALEQVHLVDALSGDGPFTVFAPTNDAFDLIKTTVGDLTMEQLQHVLEYHVSGTAIKEADLYDQESIPTLFGEHTVGVDLQERWNNDLHGRVRICGEHNAVTVTTADVLCSNGVVHIVDAVLMPGLGSDMVTV